LHGDVLHHYPTGKAFVCEDDEAELPRLLIRVLALLGGFLVEKILEQKLKRVKLKRRFFKKPFLF
jgi:tRNA pseudouridine13 synthase